jgi:hypothetical protein
MKYTAHSWIWLCLWGLLLAPMGLLGQVPRFERVVEYGSPYTSGQTAMVLDSADNLYVGGVFKEAICFSDTCVYASQQQEDEIYLASFDPEGQLRWIKIFGGAYRDWLLDMEVHSNQLYLTGTFDYRFSVGDSSWTSTGQGGFLVCMDLPGNVQWGMDFPGADVSQVAVGPEGAVWITGFSRYNKLRIGNFNLAKDTSQVVDVFWARFDAQGEVQQAQMFYSQGSRWETNLYQIEVDQDGYAYLYGGLETNVIIGQDTLWSTTNTWNQADNYLVKLSPQGEVIWSQVGMSIDQIRLDRQDRLIVTGETKDTMTWGNETILPGYYLAALNANGEPEWVFENPIMSNIFVVTGLAAENDRIYTYCRYRGPLQLPDTSYTGVPHDNFIFCHAAYDGELLWHKKIGVGDVDESSGTLELTSQGGIAISASFITYLQNYTYLDSVQVADQYPFSSSPWQYIGFTEPDTLLSTSLTEAGAQVQWAAYPNPTRDEITLTGFATDQPVRVALFTLEGKMARQQVIHPVNGQGTVALGQVTPGLYLLRVHTPQQTQLFRLIKQP